MERRMRGLMRRIRAGKRRSRCASAPVLFGALALALCCSACNKDPEPLDLVLELVQTHQELLDGLKVAVEYSESELFSTTADNEETTFWTGELDGEALDGLEGVSELSGEGRYIRETDVFRDVYWTLEVEYAELDLSAELASGESSFEVQEHLFESSYIYHDLAGSFEWNGASHEVLYSARFTFDSLQELTGTFDGEPISWETANPDVP
jgi:hypothetical protein